MCQTFDSYVENGRIVIVTRGRDEFGDDIVTHHFVSKNRALEIVKDLNDSISRV
jgi:hypothetical protein